MISETTHRVLFGDSSSLSDIIPISGEEAVHIIVTSPPYPMISMWDRIFQEQDGEIETLLETGKGSEAYEKMHLVLDRVWRECARLLVPGGIACINIGDATRRLGEDFRLYSNHSRCVAAFENMGFQVLPPIFWRKSTNAPNKFMGSGMLPPGAYVTLEHEYILLFRKGGKRSFTSEAEKKRRRESAYFWTERNTWFSDVWKIAGERQKVSGTGGAGKGRERSGAYPFSLAYRLINMYSLLGDTVLDPFLGTGTTTAAASVAGRNSLGVERDGGFLPIIESTVQEWLSQGEKVVENRLKEQKDFALERESQGKPLKHRNEHHDISVMTSQEKELILGVPESWNWISRGGEGVPAELSVSYKKAELEQGLLF